ncbi:hypothetical protein QBC47DRAFT_359500 [Echria macrotheca]|uniref:Galactose oxidase-like Early set domain-containing protein n=1 Tax=Echria macrotheca TaxID=438768 RepID=A0AAJ0BH13_9PEZI|nr:hypothetical protein QBC47DRAFT_359500 [Echria macrotheca]
MAEDAVHKGRWSGLFELQNVAVHVSLLPNGKVLYWGRRTKEKGKALEEPREAEEGADNDPKKDQGNMNQHATQAFLWDPAHPEQVQETDNQPYDLNGDTVNLFCSGHTFLADGTLLIAGGHIKDTWGTTTTTVYDFETNWFYPKAQMNEGRWYPSVVALPDGRALVMAGANEKNGNAIIPQIWNKQSGREEGGWKEASSPVLQLGVKVGVVLPLYPRVHTSPDGRVITVGPQPKTWWFDIKNSKDEDIMTEAHNISKGSPLADVVGVWKSAGTKRNAMFRDYCPSVMYAPGKIMYIGGGLGGANASPTADVEYLDISDPNKPPVWTRNLVADSENAEDLNQARRQFNATLLPDGSVLVTGGTKGTRFFNDLRPEAQVKTPELWTPDSAEWIEMNPEEVLSAGGGEYQNPDIHVKASDCHTSAQLYNPPYLCKGGPRPFIVTAPTRISYFKKSTFESFQIKIKNVPSQRGTQLPANTPPFPTLKTKKLTASGVTTTGVSILRLGSMTHCRNMSQSILFLDFQQNGDTVTVVPPAHPNLATPGYYMLFALDQEGVPSEGFIFHLVPEEYVVPKTQPRDDFSKKAKGPKDRMAAPPPPTIQPGLREYNEQVMAEQGRPPVVVGVTPVCPYGLGACWGGAFDGLRRIKDVNIVAPKPSQTNALAYVYPTDPKLIPDIDVWRKEFGDTVNASYHIRGFEMTFDGTVTKKNNGLVLTTAWGKTLSLAPFTQASQLKYDIKSISAQPVTDEETGAYGKLVKAVGAGLGKAKVTGTLQNKGNVTLSSSP